MLVFDQLKKDDPQLRLLAAIILGGMGVLLAGLWWVQVVSSREYQAHLETQSFRTVRIPALRGKILDRDGNVLAENRPTYNVSLYLDELRKPFQAAYQEEIVRVSAERRAHAAAAEKKLGRRLSKVEARSFAITQEQRTEIKQQTRWMVASNAVAQISQRFQQPLSFNPTNFEKHYETRLVLPYPVITNLTPAQIARFEEQSASPLGVDLEIQSTRVYPGQSTAAHILGYLVHNEASQEDEDASFSYRLRDYSGELGIEHGYDKELRGRAGTKSVLVNHAGYRQTENIWNPAEPGSNVVLTISLELQRAVERALPVFGPETRGAAVVMDVRTGDILAMASTPSYNPNYWIQGFPPGEFERLQDNEFRPERNRATQERYSPGSIFKPIVGLACLDAGLNPLDKVHNPGRIIVGKLAIPDTAAVGDYDFKEALAHSSNTYFISNGLHVGIERIIRLAQHLHLGEKMGLHTAQETWGLLPDLKTISDKWYDGDTANICIGQGKISVTPLHMAVMTAAFANGGKVLRPRLVERIESQDPAMAGSPVTFPSGVVLDELGVKPHSLELLQAAMYADVQEPGGTGRSAAVPGMDICGKTGTAQIKTESNRLVDHTTWFSSFAPYKDPRYAVVVMVEGGSSGGGDCAPVAQRIYLALQQREKAAALKNAGVARTP
jgi:penicillin-binding protein 2